MFVLNAIRCTSILKFMIHSSFKSEEQYQQTFVLMKTSWRRLEGLFCLCLQKMSSIRLQDVLIKTNIFSEVIHLQNTSWRRLQDALIKINMFVLAIRLQDVFKASSRHFQDALKTSCKNVFQTSSRRLQDVYLFEISSRRL